MSTQNGPCGPVKDLFDVIPLHGKDITLIGATQDAAFLGRIEMQAAVQWCCAYRGLTDPFAIHVATGVVAGGVMLYVVYVAWIYLWMGLAIIRGLLTGRWGMF
jgi:hypothetical protein